MTHTETRRYEMLVRVRDFGKAHQDLFPPDSLAGEALAAVNAAVAELAEQTVAKMTVAQGGRRAKVIARRALIERLETVSRCARVIAEDTPGFDDPFHLQYPGSDQSWLAAGRVFAKEAEARRSRFAAYGVPDIYLTSFGQLADEFERSLQTRQAGKDGHTAARAAIAGSLASGLAAIRKLDIIVPLRLHDDAVAMAVWDADRKIDRRYGRTLRLCAPTAHERSQI